MRRSAPKSKIDDRIYPVRLTVLVPEGGFGRSVYDMNDWLDERAGKRYAFHGGGTFLHAVHIYLDDPGLCPALVETFSLRLRRGEP